MWTDKEIKAFKPRDKIYFETEKTKQRGAGRFAVEISPNGSKHFYFQYYVNGKRKHILVGRFKETASSSGITSKRGRTIAGEYSELYRQGHDVKVYLDAEEAKKAEADRAKAEAGSFQELLGSYVAQMKADGKRTYNDVEKEFVRYVTGPFPYLKLKKAKDVTVLDMKLVLSRMINDLGITTQSNRVRSYLHAAFQHGLKQDNNPRNFLEANVAFNLEMNPVSAIPRQQDYERVGERFLSEDEITELWGDIQIEFGPLVGRLLKMLFALGGQRPNEVLACPWAYYDFDRRVLELPGSLTKNKRPHTVPLNDLAMSILNELKPLTAHCKYPFAAAIGSGLNVEKPIVSNSLNRAIARYCDKKGFEKFVTRDVRRTVKTHMGKAGLSKTIRDRLQNHALNDVSSKHYDKYDYLVEKKEALDVWNQYLELLINPKDNVISIGIVSND
ncbi:MAG: tyrosine-type recombinase/integrase [Pseudomonadales bacterium]|nr:tyrosine-type recombinase/integrase [Pseudomonadales bacterium]